MYKLLSCPGRRTISDPRTAMPHVDSGIKGICLLNSYQTLPRRNLFGGVCYYKYLLHFDSVFHRNTSDILTVSILHIFTGQQAISVIYDCNRSPFGCSMLQSFEYCRTALPFGGMLLKPQVTYRPFRKCLLPCFRGNAQRYATILFQIQVAG